MGGWKDMWMDGKMGGWMDEGMDGKIGGYLVGEAGPA